MSWEELNAKTDEKAKKEHAEKVLVQAKAYARCFATEEGKKVLQLLSNEFIMGNDTPLNAPNINYEAAYHNGEAGVIKYILKQIERAQYE